MGSDEEIHKSNAVNMLKVREEVEDKKKMNDDLVVFMRKRSESEAPRYTARLKTYVNFQEKRRRAAAARKRSQHLTGKPSKKKVEPDHKEKLEEKLELHSSDRHGADVGDRARRGHNYRICHHEGSRSRDWSLEPGDRCGRRRRRRRRCGRRRRRRRRSCRRRRRRRRSCRRRRRRRSCRRRRRRRSCRRRRRRSCRRRRRRRRRRSCRRRRRRCR